MNYLESLEYLVNHIDKGVIIIDEKYKIIYKNRWIEKKITIIEKAKRLEDIFNKDFYNNKIKIKLERSFSKKSYWTLYYALNKKRLKFEDKGKTYMFNLNFLPFLKNKILIIFDDISDEIKKIEELNCERNKLEKSKAKLKNELFKEKFFNELGKAIKELLEDENSLIKGILKIVKKYSKADGITFFKADYGKLYLLQETNVDTKTRDNFKIIDKNSNTLTSTVVNQKEVVLIDDIDKIKNKYLSLRGLKSKSIIILPIKDRKNNILGIIHLGFLKKQKFTNSKKMFYTSVSNYISLIYETYKTLEEKEKISKRLKNINKYLGKKLKNNIKILNTQHEIIEKHDKLSIMNKLNASLSHEIKTPLTYVKINAELLKSQTNELKKAISENSSNKISKIMENFYRISEDILIGIDKIANIGETISDFLRESSSAETIDLYKQIDESIKLVNIGNTDKEAIETRYEGDKLLIKFPSSKLIQIMLNLLVNAVDAVKEIPNKRIQIRAGREDENHFYIEIEDNGYGIEKDNIKNIFLPFYSTKKKNGTGLGLFVIKQIIENNKGNILIDSKKDKGTKFKIILPIGGEKYEKNEFINY